MRAIVGFYGRDARARGIVNAKAEAILLTQRFQKDPTDYWFTHEQSWSTATVPLARDLRLSRKSVATSS